MPTLLRIVALLSVINLAPPLLSYLLGDRWSQPLDRERLFKDGRPFFGPHKTTRGFVSGVFSGALLAPLLGMPVWLGFAAGALSMSGDLTSSFIKRRRNLESGSNVPGLDQCFEAVLPFFVFVPYYRFGLWQALVCILIFSVGAYAGSRFLKEVLRKKPYENYPRRVSPAVRMRELRRCQILSHPWHHVLNLKKLLYYRFFMRPVFKMSGIYQLGQRNALDLRNRNLEFNSLGLPKAFDGYTILFMTDLHLDGLEGLTERLCSLVEPSEADLCLIGGDYRMEEYGSFSTSLGHIERLRPLIHTEDGVYSVLGNHDCLEMIEPLEQLDIHFLVNEAVAIEREGQRIWIVGVDDPHYYCCHDLDSAFENVPKRSFSILLSHSPEIFAEAAPFGPNLYLCGHTHAGQIQLPGIGPISTHTRGPRFVCEGAWSHDGMQGYTSSGVGVSGAPVRFFSRGEIVRITLRRAHGGIREAVREVL